MPSGRRTNNNLKLLVQYDNHTFKRKRSESKIKYNFEKTTDTFLMISIRCHSQVFPCPCIERGAGRVPTVTRDTDPNLGLPHEAPTSCESSLGGGVSTVNTVRSYTHPVIFVLKPNILMVRQDLVRPRSYRYDQLLMVAPNRLGIEWPCPTCNVRASTTIILSWGVRILLHQ